MVYDEVVMKLQLKGEVNIGERRFGVEVLDSSYYVRDEIYDWCCGQFGNRNNSYNNPRWIASHWKETFWFKYEKDRDWFILRWS